MRFNPHNKTSTLTTFKLSRRYHVALKVRRISAKQRLSCLLFVGRPGNFTITTSTTRDLPSPMKSHCRGRSEQYVHAGIESIVLTDGTPEIL
jgi:hypothetical protein